jgi:hypothetical protein
VPGGSSRFVVFGGRKRKKRLLLRRRQRFACPAGFDAVLANALKVDAPEALPGFVRYSDLIGTHSIDAQAHARRSKKRAREAVEQSRRQ